MADREIHVVDPARQAQMQMIEDMKRLKEHPLNVSVPGGYFLNPDKKSAHDAEGNTIPLRSEDSIKNEVAEIVKAEAAAEEAAPPVEPKASARKRGR